MPQGHAPRFTEPPLRFRASRLFSAVKASADRQPITAATTGLVLRASTSHLPGCLDARIRIGRGRRECNAVVFEETGFPQTDSVPRDRYGEVSKPNAMSTNIARACS